MEKIRFVDVVHIIGSIASITGISLLWIRAQLNIQTLLIDIPIIILIVTFCLGIASLGIILIRFGYRQFAHKFDTVWKFAYFAISIPVVSAIVGWFLFIVSYLVMQEINIMKG